MDLILRNGGKACALIRVEERQFTGPGRFVHDLTVRTGETIEKIANKLSSKFGHDPSAVADRIEQLLGSSPEERQSILETLYSSNHDDPKLSRLCSKLLNFASPSSSPVTQRTTFERIILLITRYAGLRLIFSGCRQKGPPNPIEEIASSWKRHDCDPEAEWEFLREFAGFALQTTNISNIVEKPRPSSLGSIEFPPDGDSESSNLNPVPIEELLMVCRDGLASDFSCLAAIRYLSGIFELPAFWAHDSNNRGFHDILNNICETALRLVTDADSNNDSVEEIYAWRRPSLNCIDATTHAFLVGLMKLKYKPRTLNELHKQLSRPECRSRFPDTFHLLESNSVIGYLVQTESPADELLADQLPEDSLEPADEVVIDATVIPSPDFALEEAVTEAMTKQSHRSIFALIIGINAYESFPLQGCVKDAQRFEKHLTAIRQVPAVNIKTLIDATRKEIIDSFHSHLIDNPAVPKNATIIFYFAGHGSRVPAPHGWQTRAANGHIETLCPVDDGRMRDDGTRIPGIPDLTINALLSKLALKKGDNVIVILDCCHAGGAARGPSQSPRLRVREKPKPEADQQTTFPSEEVVLWNADLPLAFQARHLHSHILLAACTYSSPALEDTEGGLFTSALLNELKISGNRSYQELMKSVADDLDLRESRQRPVCYGTNMHRLIFDRSVSLPQKFTEFALHHFSTPVGDMNSNVDVFSNTNSKLGTLQVSDSTTSHTFFTYKEGDFFPISHPAEAAEAVDEAMPKQTERLKLSLSVPVGRLHGANSTTQFVVISDDQQIGRLKVSDCYPTHCTLQYDGGAFDIPRDAVARMLPSDLTILDVSLAGDWLQSERDSLQLASNYSTHSFRLIDSEHSNTADVELSWTPDSSYLGVKWKAPLLASDTAVNLPMAKGDMERLLSAVQSIANFRYHLCRPVSSSQQVENNTSPGWSISGWIPGFFLNLFGNKSESNLWNGLDNSLRNADGLIRGFQVHLYELTHNSEGFRIPNRETDYLVPSCQPIAGGPSRLYGIEVVNHSPRDVFPYLFSFDPSNYEIQLLNQATTDRDDVLAGFYTQGTKTKKLTIGFGEGGGHPITFTPGETIFFKLFISDESCGNLQFMEQTGVSERFKPRLKQGADRVLSGFSGADRVLSDFSGVHRVLSNFSDAFLFKVVVQT